jgi:hypothetical protein
MSGYFSSLRSTPVRTGTTRVTARSCHRFAVHPRAYGDNTYKTGLKTASPAWKSQHTSLQQPTSPPASHAPAVSHRSRARSGKDRPRNEVRIRVRPARSTPTSRRASTEVGASISPELFAHDHAQVAKKHARLQLDRVSSPRTDSGTRSCRPGLRRTPSRGSRVASAWPETSAGPASPPVCNPPDAPDAPSPMRGGRRSGQGTALRARDHSG